MLVSRLSIVESIPENLTYSAGSPSHYSTYQSWMDLLAAARSSVDIAAYYWTLQGRGKVTDVTDKEVRSCLGAVLMCYNSFCTTLL